MSMFYAKTKNVSTHLARFAIQTLNSERPVFHQTSKSIILPQFRSAQES